MLKDVIKKLRIEQELSREVWTRCLSARIKP